MCSWCWGFSPVIDRIAQDYGDRTPLALLLGGLFPDTSAPMDEAFKTSLREHWEHVQQLTGQPFNFELLEHSRFIYNTEPACRAVVTSRRLRPGAELGFLHALHAAFYRDNRDVTAAETLCDIAAENGFARERFEIEFASARAETRRDFALAQELGVHGFPSLLGCSGGRIVMLTEGYQPLPRLIASIDAWLEHDVSDAMPAGIDSGN
ncbi:MAG: DsbA family protein [Gammaproteobacteria bacterium]|nr:DsbA family protein [Gammaproteobacteria bacterium]